MITSTVGLPLVVQPFPQHLELKELLLDLLSSCGEWADQPQLGVGKTRTDWYTERSNWSRSWYTLLVRHLDPLITTTLSSLGLGRYTMQSMWFQQYSEGGFHQWHVHEDASYAWVYYLELDPGAPATAYREFLTSTVKHFDAREGDIVMFPGSLPHSSLTSNLGRKTIIAWNTLADL